MPTAPKRRRESRTVVESTNSLCPECPSPNLAEFIAEIGLHFHGLARLNKVTSSYSPRSQSVSIAGPYKENSPKTMCSALGNLASAQRAPPRHRILTADTLASGALRAFLHQPTEWTALG